MRIKETAKGIFKAQGILSKKHKYCIGNKASRTWQGKIDGSNATIVFDSKVEMFRFSELRLLEMAGKIRNLQRQIRFLIIPKNGKEQPAYYTPDFTYSENGKEIAEEIKSAATKQNRDYVLRRKLFKIKYPDIEFREVIR